jgi:hypothetical protein
MAKHPFSGLVSRPTDRPVLVQRPWAGWFTGWLFLDGAWRKCCFTATEQECRHVLRERARRLKLLNVPADINHGDLPDWTPQQGALEDSSQEEE